MARRSPNETSVPLVVDVPRPVRYSWPTGLLLGLVPLALWAAAAWFYQAGQIAGVAHTPVDSAAMLGWIGIGLGALGLLVGLSGVRSARWRPLAIGSLGGLGLSTLGGLVIAVVWPFMQGG